MNEFRRFARVSRDRDGRGDGPFDPRFARDPRGHRGHGHDHAMGPGFGPDFGGPDFGGRRRGGGRMRRGEVRTSLLIALLDGPSHGYDLIQKLEEKSGGRWRPSPGSVYPALQLLDDEGLVTSRRDDDKQVFELTETGRTQATEHLERHGTPWDAFGDDNDHGKLRVAMRDLGMAARQIGMTGSPEVVAKAVETVTQARKDLYRLLADS